MGSAWFFEDTKFRRRDEFIYFLIIVINHDQASILDIAQEITQNHKTMLRISLIKLDQQIILEE